MTINSIHNKNLKNASTNIIPNQWLIASKGADTKIAIADLNAKKRAEREITEFKATIQKNTSETWLIYQKRLPEAFLNNSRLLTKTPQVEFYDYVEDVQKKFPKLDPDALAFVNSGEPNKFYCNISKNFNDYKKYGFNEIKATIAHELMHCLTNNTVIRITMDSTSEKQSYKGVKKDLSENFILPYGGHKGEKLVFSVADLLREGAADILSMMITGIRSQHDYYKPYRDMTEKLIQKVGLATYKKAFLENSRPAYMAVVKAAIELKTACNDYYNKNIYSNPAKRIINRIRREIDL